MGFSLLKNLQDWIYSPVAENAEHEDVNPNKNDKGAIGSNSALQQKSLYEYNNFHSFSKKIRSQSEKEMLLHAWPYLPEKDRETGRADLQPIIANDHSLAMLFSGVEAIFSRIHAADTSDIRLNEFIDEKKYSLSSPECRALLKHPMVDDYHLNVLANLVSPPLNASEREDLLNHPNAGALTLFSLAKNGTQKEREAIEELPNVPDRTMNLILQSKTPIESAVPSQLETLLANQKIGDSTLSQLITRASEQGKLAILSHPNAGSLTFAHFVPRNALDPTNASSQQRIAIAKHPNADNFIMVKLAKTARIDALEERVALVNNKSTDFDTRIQLIDEMPLSERLMLANDPNTSSRLIESLRYRFIRVREGDLIDKVPESSAELEAIIAHQNASDSDLHELSYEATPNQRLVMARHPNAEDLLTLSHLAEDAASNECELILKHPNAGKRAFENLIQNPNASPLVIAEARRRLAL